MGISVFQSEEFWSNPSGSNYVHDLALGRSECSRMSLKESDNTGACSKYGDQDGKTPVHGMFLV